MFSVILVDDEPWALKGLRSSFDWTQLGFNIIGETCNPLEALELINNNKPDLVFTDIRMPKLNGLELIKECKSIGIDCEFVIISGFADFEYAQQAIEFDVLNYVLKPIELEKVNQLLINIHNKLRKKKDIHEYLGNMNFADNNSYSSTNVNDSFKDMLEYINNHYCDKNITLKMLSNEFNLNTTYICDLFKKIVNKTFSNYLTELRMTRACSLLKYSSLPIYEIAEQVGYETYYFNTIFKKTHLCTPTQYRKGV